jgi:hypothetical protein
MVTMQFLKKASLYQCVSLLILALVTLFFWPRALVSLAAGGLLMAGNFWLLRVLVQKAFSGPRPKLIYGLVVAVKLMAVLAVMAVCILTLHLKPLPFAVGLATLFLGIAIATLTLGGAVEVTPPVERPPATPG